MALAVNALTSGSDTVDRTTYTTASVTPTANALVLVAAYSRRNPGVDVSSISGNGLTWVKIASVTSTALTFRYISLWRAMGASPSAGTIGITWAGQCNNSAWSVFEITGTDTSGTDGSGAIVQSGTSPDPSTGTSGTITLSAFGSTNNMGVGFFHHNADEATTPGSGFTEIHDIQISENTAGMNTEYKVNDNTVDASWTTSIDWLGIAIEVKQDTSTSSIKTINGLAYGSVKTVNDLAIASVKTVNGLS